MTGRVVLVGAGPGDPDLLTVRALRELGLAEVLLYDALIAPAILELVAPGAERIDVGKRGDGTRGVSQDEIAGLLIARARAGRYVVRLKGGDPFVFGRGGEEASALQAAGVPFEVVPGISAALAVPAYAGIPVTDRRFSSSFAIVTGHRGGNVADQRTDWEGLARSAETLVVLMGTAWVSEIVDRVIRGGRDPATPAALIEAGTRPGQRVIIAPLRELPARVSEASVSPPTLIVIGEVARLHETLEWYSLRPLFGRRVLVLRGREQRAPLQLELARAGAEAVSVPLMQFAPTAHPEPLRRALERAGAYDWLVYTSANAVHFARPPAEVPRVACIGDRSADAARAAGLRVDLAPAIPSTPERLAAALLAEGSLAGARILLPQSEKARDTLAALLEREGASVDRVEAYRNLLPAEAAGELAAALEGGVDAVCLTSPSSVERLLELLGGSGFAALATNSALVCVGPTTADALRSAGQEPAAVASEQSDRGLVDALSRYYTEARNGLS